MKKYLETTKEIDKFLSEKDSILAGVIDEIGQIRREVDEDHFKSLVKSIVSQQLSTKVAKIIYTRLETLCKNKIEYKVILDLEDEKLREIGLSYSKISYIKNLAMAVNENVVSFDKIEYLTDEEIIAMLTKVKGIGQWTAEMFLMFSLGREDVFSFGDGGLQNAVKNLYKIDGKIKKSELQDIGKNWAPYRSYASLYLWEYLKLV